MTDLVIPDVSEFQTVTSLPVAAIVRAHNGWRTDDKWALHAPIARRDCAWWAAYQYLPKSVDPVAARRAFDAVVAGSGCDAVVLDLEEGDGDQTARALAWLSAGTGFELVYSGLYFMRQHLAGLPASQPRWIAAYQAAEPTDAHTLWQFTDARTFPGIAAPCDASIFHGTVDDLITLTGGTMISEQDKAEIADAVWAKLLTSAYDGKQATTAQFLVWTNAAAGHAADALKNLPALVASELPAQTGLTAQQVQDAVTAALSKLTLRAGA